MKRAFKGIVLAAALGSSFFITGCTTEQRSGRSTGQYVDDKTLNMKVRSALSDSVEYKFSDVKVDTFRGTVQLSGFVSTDAQKQRAGEIVKSVTGVQNVENRISIKKA